MLEECTAAQSEVIRAIVSECSPCLVGPRTGGQSRLKDAGARTGGAAGIPAAFDLADNLGHCRLEDAVAGLKARPLTGIFRRLQLAGQVASSWQNAHTRRIHRSHRACARRRGSPRSLPFDARGVHRIAIRGDSGHLMLEECIASQSEVIRAI